MPNLPGLDNLSQAHFDRITASFPGATAAEKVAAYRRWLTNRLIERVRMVESSNIEAEVAAVRAAAVQRVEDSLPPKMEEPPLP